MKIRLLKRGNMSRLEIIAENDGEHENILAAHAALSSNEENYKFLPTYMPTQQGVHLPRISLHLFEGNAN